MITFDVGGQIITNQRATFNQILNSTFNITVSCSKTTKFDNKSDVFVDYDPKLFRYLINQLRKKSSKNICSLEAPSAEGNVSFQRMLNDLGICKQLLPSTHINIEKKWKQNGVTIAGGNSNGNQLNQLYDPQDIYIDDDRQSIYIADHNNHRIVEWKLGAENGQVVAGGNGEGNRMNQLNQLTDAVVDKKNDFIIICDYANRRVMRWSRRNRRQIQTIISHINCWGLTMDNSGDLYVSDYMKNEVRRWKIGDTNGIIVAGGNGPGEGLNQFNSPTHIFVDGNHSVYVSDFNNHRVMKWMKGVKEAIVVAGGQGEGSSLTQLSHLYDVFVDHLGNAYVTDTDNNRIMRWSSGSRGVRV